MFYHHIMAGMYQMRDLLELLLSEHAAELHLAPGHAPALVTNGHTHAAALCTNLTADEIEVLFNSISTPAQQDELLSCGDIHFIHSFQNSRLSVTASSVDHVLHVVIRSLAQ